MNWEKEFDNKFDQSEICLQVCHPSDKKELFDFISSLLSQQKAEIVERVKEWALDNKQDWNGWDYVHLERLEKFCDSLTVIEEIK